MPVWHEETQKLRDQQEIEVVGIIQEQHPDRCKLFMQWKQIDWPVFVDPLNLLEVSVVPIALLIDEQGVVRERLQDPRTAGKKLLAERDAIPTGQPESPKNQEDHASTLRRVSDAVLFEKNPRFEEAIHQLDEAVSNRASDGRLHFARGAVYRMRYDSPQRRNGDFAAAVAGWQTALDLNPNQYIWRRRIQQYGPRLDKPYPFYDWVGDARRDIRARGQTPIKLTVEPAGAELAAPATEFSIAAEDSDQPDPDGRITRDSAPLILIETTAIPARIHPGKASRIHVVLRPNSATGGHWNNESDPLTVWVAAPPGWSINNQRLTVPLPPQAVSDEPRTVEFEVRAPDDATAGEVSVSGYALYGVCEGVSGTCLHRRQDIAATIGVTSPD